MINIRYRSFQILVHYSSAFTIIYTGIYILHLQEYKHSRVCDVHTSGVVIAYSFSDPSPDHITILHLLSFISPTLLYTTSLSQSPNVLNQMDLAHRNFPHRIMAKYHC